MESRAGRRSCSLTVGPSKGYESSLFQVPIQVAATTAQAGSEEFVASGTVGGGARDSLVVLVLISEGSTLVDLRGGHGVCGARCGQEGHW